MVIARAASGPLHIAFHANEYAPCICVLDEGHLFCVEEAKRLLGLQVCCEAIPGKVPAVEADS